ncbi:YpmS family protein [Sporosarcina oncorhynchi]|uniref:YpmS family protein n=1 Tax=Sporosarcina oncorhynchi TaxID=3056444 RepID=A0ABZ0L8W8_9BACL|nr:YpmS family protein [Sporosarcina sp. T2O-4]WOV88981.1 YpmS family protein [Sporosarcina sp. T2O-4]
MNRWKIAFLGLVGLIIAGIVALVIFIESPGDSDPLPITERYSGNGSVLSVKASRDDLEGLANTYIGKAMKGEQLPVMMRIEDDVILHSELIAFSFKVPINMHFDPVVLADGNLLLKQTSMEIGPLDIPPETVLKLLRDSIKLPEWMVVRPKEEEIFINLAELPVSGNLHVRAKTLNLAEDDIVFEVTIPHE